MGEQTIPNGSMVIVTKSHEGPEGFVRDGDKFVVDYFVPAETVDGVDFPDTYVGSSPNGFDSYDAHAEFVELYKTPEEAAKVGPPSREEVARAVADAVMGIWNEPFSVHTGDAPHPDGTDFEATTDDGVEFVFQVKINWVESTSW